MEPHPLFKVFLTGINNIEDPSGILQPRAAWNIAQNLDVTIAPIFFMVITATPAPNLAVSLSRELIFAAAAQIMVTCGLTITFRIDFKRMK